jgi:hypothetical protein
MDRQIIIGIPYKRYCDNNKVQLCADISRWGETYSFFFEVDKEYEQYLNDQRADCFFLIILEYAMHNSLDIVCKAPLSERIYYQAVNYLIPIVTKNVSLYHPINVEAPLVSETLQCAQKVGTGFSCGVDSFYSVLKHMKNKEKDFSVTHLLFANVGALKHDGGEVSKRIFDQKLKRFSSIAAKLGLSLISVHSNSMEFYLDRYYTPNVASPCALKTCACVHLLGGLFSVFYFASGLGLEKFGFLEDPASYDLLTLSMISTDSLSFYSTGMEVNRISKVAYIVDNPIVQAHLSVDADENCSRCDKCYRTMFELYALNKLDAYSQVFDIPYFLSNIDKIAEEYFSKEIEWFDGFADEILQAMRQRGEPLPPWAQKAMDAHSTNVLGAENALTEKQLTAEKKPGVAGGSADSAAISNTRQYSATEKIALSAIKVIYTLLSRKPVMYRKAKTAERLISTYGMKRGSVLRMIG